MQGDNAPCLRDLSFAGSVFSASRSWVPILNTEPLLFGQSVGHVVVEVILLAGCRVFSGWCLAERCIETFHIDSVTLKSVHEVRFHPCRRAISYGRDVLLKTR